MIECPFTILVDTNEMRPFTFVGIRADKKDGEQGASHLGFIIDDVAPTPSVGASGERVNLYGYTSMAVAALQVQAAQLQTQKAELDALKQELAELKQRVGSKTCE